MTQKQRIQEILHRGVENIYPSSEALQKVLLSGKKLKIYNGIDPTGRLHIGHGVVLLKLRQLQELGHHIIVLIGDFTAQIGDPTDKMAARKPLTHKEVLQNARFYKKLIGKILDLKKTEFRYNSKWLLQLSSLDFMHISSYFTAQQTLARNMFRQRMKEGKDLFLNEFMYPILQAYDSVAMDIDLEVGGNDQMFNMLAGRTLMKKMKGKEKFVMTTKLLTDPAGKKMGKTEGNFVALEDPPDAMYGKIMSWPDELIVPGFELATPMPLTEVIQAKKDLEAGRNPKVLKMLLAYKITEFYWNTNAAIAAEETFKKIHIMRETPANIPEVLVTSRALVEALVETRLAPSKTKARRLLIQGGIKVNGEVITDEKYTVLPNSILQKGKRHFIKIL